MKTTDPKIERRSFSVAELRMDDEGRMVGGHAAVFDQMSHEMWGIREKIAHGAFSETIVNDDVRALWNHNPDQVLGRTKSGTLKLREDTRGLAFEVDVASTQAGHDALELIRRGDVDEMSFGFIAIEDEWEHGEGRDEVSIRTLKKVRLLDVSPVTYPAYPGTDVDVAVRSLKAWQESEARANQPTLATRKRQADMADVDLW